MALPDSFKQSQGLAIKTWKASPGSPSAPANDYLLTCTSLGNGSARQGAKGDLGALFAQRWHVLFTSSVTLAAANGLGIELYWAPSTSATAGTDNPGLTTGADASLGSPDEAKLQLVLIGVLSLMNSGGTGVQKQPFEFYPSTRYGMPVVVNKSGQAIGPTAADHTIVMTPIELTAEENV